MTATEETGEFSIEDAVRRFSDAESALRQILANADRLSAASERLDEARASIAEARAAGEKRLEEARAAIAQADLSGAKRLEEARAAIAEAEISGAKRLEEARAGLRKSESSLAEASSAVYGLTVELKDIAGDLKDTALGFRRLKPDELWSELAAIREAQRRILLFVVLALVAGIAATVAALT